jgi:hypothetical protein
LRGVRASPTNPRPFPPLADRPKAISSRGSSIRRPHSIPPSPTPSRTSTSISPCPATSTPDFSARRRIPRHRLQRPSRHPADPFAVPHPFPPSSPLADPARPSPAGLGTCSPSPPHLASCHGSSFGRPTRRRSRGPPDLSPDHVRDRPERGGALEVHRGRLQDPPHQRRHPGGAGG